MSKLIKLPGGSSVLASSILGIRVSRAYPAVAGRPAFKPRVNVDYGIGDQVKSSVIECDTDEERDTIAADITLKWEEAVR